MADEFTPRMNPVLPADTSPMILPYPAGALRRLLRAPLLVYRLGLGGLLHALRILILTTHGRRSGQPRHTPIEYRRHGKKIYLISGWGDRPNWFQNLKMQPQVTVQLGRQAQAARAQIVTDPAEALRALYLFRRAAPERYDTVLSYVIDATVTSKTLPNLSGQFTIVRLDVTADPPPLPGLAADLTWFWPVLLAAGAGLALFGFVKGRKG